MHPHAHALSVAHLDCQRVWVVHPGTAYSRTLCQQLQECDADTPLLFMPLPQQPLFPGDSEWQQLLHIFKLLGTPNENVWPGVSRLRDW
jgi:hypothetical protein